MVDVRIRKPVAICAGLFVVGLVSFSCSSPKPASTPLWGDLKPVVSVKELMHDMIDPIADYVFESVRIVTTAQGTVETYPRTEEDWDKIRVGGVTLAEGAYLLKIPRPFAPPGDENNSAGPNAPELSPAQMVAKIEKDPVLWNAKIEALRNVGLEVLEIVKQKNVDRLWDAGEDLDIACETCHIEYWYPGEKGLWDKLDRRLEELYGPRASKKPFGMGK